VRRGVEEGLTSRSEGFDFVANETYTVSAISEEFHFDSARIGQVSDIPTLQVLFRWDGYIDLFGMQTSLDSLDEQIAECAEIRIPWSGLFCVHFEEDLLAFGHEIENAEKHRDNSVVWLTWPGSRWIASVN
jgi:hypothetical protein